MPPKESNFKTAVNRFIKNAYRHLAQKWVHCAEKIPLLDSLLCHTCKI